MTTNRFTRRDLVCVLAAIPAAVGFEAAADNAPAATVAAQQEISHTAVAIHQEVLLHASRRRVYHALTDGRAFDRVVQLSEAIKSGMISAQAAPSRISPRVGGTFSLFGGYISGFQLELMRDRRIVQAWRTGSWAPGDYSIASYSLADEGSGTRLVFDHQGFPGSEAQHLAEGWHENYWQPLAESLTRAA